MAKADQTTSTKTTIKFGGVIGRVTTTAATIPSWYQGQESVWTIDTLSTRTVISRQEHIIGNQGWSVTMTPLVIQKCMAILLTA